MGKSTNVMDVTSGVFGGTENGTISVVAEEAQDTP